MNTLTYRITLDTRKNGVQRVLQGFETGESTARKISITLKEGADDYELPLSNISAQMYVKRPSDESPSINACTIDAENNKILYDLTDQDIAEAGLVELQLKLIDTIGEETKVLVSPKFAMEVWESNIEDSEAENTPVYTALTEALAAAQAMHDSAIKDLYIDEDNIFTVVFGDDTTYTSTVIADAIGRIDSVEEFALKSEGHAVGEQYGVPVPEESPYYHNNSKYYSDQAGASALSASTSETNAALSETHAATSEANASTSETNAAASESAAATSEANAALSEANASTSETNAHTYANSAGTSATNAYTSEQNASASATSASGSATSASQSAPSASASATSAESFKDSAQTYANTSKSYAVGGTSTRPGEENDNAKYYKEQCEQIAAGIAGGLIPMGTVAFANLPTTGLAAGMMYNISDTFVSDSRFKDGGGKSYPAGTNAYVTADLMWDCFAGALITVNNKTGQSITLDGSDLKVSGYSKAAQVTDVAGTDTINEAIGKVEKKVDSSVMSFKGRSGAVTPADDDYTIGQIKATGSEGQAPLLDSNGKLAMSNIVKSFNGRHGVVTATFGDYSANQIDMTGYTKASTSSAITTSDSASSAIGKLEKKVDDALSGGVVTHDFVITTTDWETNDNTRNNDEYTVKQEIDASYYSGTDSDKRLEYYPMSATVGEVMTTAEYEDALKLGEAETSATKIIIYATEATENALRIRVLGV
ncbi:MAG: hypothetical protein J6U37_05635 [Lachnospiraceae bacterium]|nr:hypothetical protein [Lachnospiraceae bacterium]